MAHTSPIRPPPPARSVRRALGALAAGFLALLGGCGEGPPGGRGALHAAGSPGTPAHLVVEGSPYQMGWWQGRLLAGRIRALHAAWGEALLAATVGGSGPGGARAALEERLDLYVDQCLHRLPERLLQELEGLAAGSGIEAERLLRLEVMRDALRLEGLPPRLPGALAVARSDEGLEARAWWAGPDAGRLGAEWIVIERRPQAGAPTLSVTWPGSLGGLALVRADGRAALSVELEVPERARLGFGSGWPFAVALRVAVEDSAGLEEQLVRTRGTVGHGQIALVEPRARGVVVEGRARGERSEAVAEVEVNVGSDEPRGLGAGDLLALGPYPDARHPLAEQLARETQADPARARQTRAERLAAVRAHAAGRPDRPPPAGPWIALRFGSGKAQLTLHAADGAGARTITLAAGPGAAGQR